MPRAWPWSTTTSTTLTAGDRRNASPAPARGRSVGQREQGPTAQGERQAPDRTAESSGSAEDPVHTYLKEIGRVPLLNAALEVEIAQAIEVGNEAAGRLRRARVGRDGERAGDGPAEGYRADAATAAWCARVSRPRTS